MKVETCLASIWGSCKCLVDLLDALAGVIPQGRIKRSTGHASSSHEQPKDGHTLYASHTVFMLLTRCARGRPDGVERHPALKGNCEQLSEKSGHLKHHHSERVTIIGGEPWRYSEGNPIAS
jgi:hypothetical protein